MDYLDPVSMNLSSPSLPELGLFGHVKIFKIFIGMDFANLLFVFVASDHYESGEWIICRCDNSGTG
jgi:hypothetical protein